MEEKALRYCIGWLLCLLTVLPVQAQSRNDAQNRNRPVAKKEKKDKKPEIEYPLFNGIMVGVDAWGPANSLLGSDFLSSEVAVCADLKHRFFPTVELGFGKTDTWSDKGIHYKTAAPYFRIGVDYNSLYKKKHGHMLLIGLRYAFSSFNYDVASLGINDPIYGGGYNPNIKDPVWGETIPFDRRDMKSSMHWAEFSVGIRAHVWRALYMGWSLRFKFKMSASTDRYGDPWYVPGFGKYGSNTLGVAYHIIYKLPL